MSYLAATDLRGVPSDLSYLSTLPLYVYLALDTTALTNVSKTPRTV